MAKAVSFISIFVLCKIAVSLAGRLLSSLFKSSSLTLLNRSGGAFLGLLKGLVIIMIIVLAVLAFLPADSSLIAGSQTLPYIASMPKITVSVVPEDIRKKYNEKVEELRKVK
jgi:membrane protein required for colicin V production